MHIVTNSLLNLNLPPHCEYEIIETICDWERLAYGENKHRTPKEFFRCIEKNRAGFFVSLVEDKLVGYADVWQLHSDFYNDLRVGLIDEESLNASVIFSEDEAGSSCWYIGSMIIEKDFRKANPVCGAFVFASLSDSLPAFFRKFSEYPAKVLGVGSSAFGKKLLSKWKCIPVDSHPDAIDTRPRYEKTLNHSGDENCFYIRKALSHKSMTS